MKFDIVGIDETYGSHRTSNNDILKELSYKSEPCADLKFVWWVELMFLDSKYRDIANSLCNTDWFGVMHVPPLCPNWAMEGQNDLSSLYFDKTWNKALKRCKAIICLSEHMAMQIRALYPEINVFSTKHPVSQLTRKFRISDFLEKKQMVLVGAWLRDYEAFVNTKTKYTKAVLFTKYARNYLKNTYKQYVPSCNTLLSDIEILEFLEDTEYDKLITTSLVFLGVHETSANNALCECITSNTPFIALRHPAIAEYCGLEYPLLLDSYGDEVTDTMVVKAHEYLKSQEKLKKALSLNSFIESVSKIYSKIIRVRESSQNPLIDIFIVTPSFNSASTIKDTLLSVYEQNIEGLRVHHHVQDCSSTDSTTAILEKWAEEKNSIENPHYIFTFNSRKDEGMYDAIKKGFANFSMNDESWMTWINADDQLAKGCLSTLFKIEGVNPEIGWVTGFPSVRKENGEELVFNRYYSSSIIKKGICDSKRYRTVQQEGTFWKYKYWKNLKLDDVFTNYSYAGDFSLWCNLALYAEIYQVEKTLAWFNRRDGQLSQKYKEKYLAEVNACKEQLENTPSVEKFVAKVIDLAFKNVRLVDVNIDNS